MMQPSLAIVIPAYKNRFLDAALSSIANQTNLNFKVYISDDGSPEDIKSIVDRYSQKINIQYNRFDDNVGRNDLVKHWNRSVALATEEWIWLFSDDDVMLPGCTQAFFDALVSTNCSHNVYRFNIEMTDAQDRVICVKDAHPVTESGYAFLKRRLQSKSLSAAIEYIFKKEVFNRHNGFINFPSAYCSDDASWIVFSEDKNIYTITHQKIYWRASGVNISSGNAFVYEKAMALLLFTEHILNKYPEKRTELLALSEPWFYENLNYIKGRISIAQGIHLVKKAKTIFSLDTMLASKKIISWQLGLKT